MRRLRADRVYELSSGLWVLDRVHPVAVVLDPTNGQLRHVVSWEQEPAPEQLGAFRRVIAAEDGLWVQENGLDGGPLLRVGLDGIEKATWPNRWLLAAAGPGGAWCSRPTDVPQRVDPTDEFAEPEEPYGWDVLLHVTADGRVSQVETDTAVSMVHTTEQAAWVRLERPPYTLEPTTSPDMAFVRWTDRWIALPWGQTPPAKLSAAEGTGEGDAVFEAALDLVAGPLAPAATPGALERRESVALNVQRGFAPYGTGNWPWTVHQTGLQTGAGEGGGSPADTVLRDERVAGGGREVPLAALEDLDISAWCWARVPRPVEVDSYLQRVLAAFGSMSATWLGSHGGHTLDGRDVVEGRLLGEWPDARLEWTFGHTSRPGLILRRRVDLFDEVGRIEYPEYADVGLMEDLSTDRIPPAERARDGVLDM
ncbi:hypothetical protein ACFEMC_10650 [Kineococcus sp. DHX-1]|uniref:hypothetical protein n=1 Tax=Kineococcus sp. DHX-1 TaxID=3349638 RepID=UPI0036D428D9